MVDPFTVAVVTEVLAPAAGEGAKWSLGKMIKHIEYIYKYKKNLESLKDAKEDLDAMRKDGVLFVEEASSKVNVVGNNASLWMSRTKELSENAQETISRNNISCLNVCSRYATSKTASKMTGEIKEKVQNAPKFGNEFKDATLKLGDKYDLKGFMELKSRASVVNNVLEALKEEDVQMCSMVGMGGTGKTMLAKKLLQKVEDDPSFHKAVMVTVSYNFKSAEIQKEIIELLKIEIGESSMSARAIKLKKWLTDERVDKKMTVLILDDVWSDLKNEAFEEIGIPLRCNKCKIVVTSRNEEECRQMGSQRNFPIEYLDDEEAWDLFRNTAGERVDDRDLNLRDTAQKIAHKCGGLPLVINTIAAALKYQNKSTWNDTLVNLENVTDLDIPEVARAYRRIYFSYDLLKDKDAEACFRLFSLFPKGCNVPIEDLVLFAQGLHLFEKIDSMKQVRERVESKLDKLKNLLLLVNGQKKGCVRMHDILRDLAISISSKEHPYIVGFEKVMKKWPESSQYQTCRAISLVCDKIKEHPLDLSCPKLELLQVLLDDDDDQVGLPNAIFEELKELKVLILNVPSLSQSLAMLKKLRILIIGTTKKYRDRIERVNSIGDLLGGNGDLSNLEILVITNCKQFSDFPVEIGALCSLRVLKFDRIHYEYMAPGVLSKLVKLEELYLSWQFDSWGELEISWAVKDGDCQRCNAGLEEIESLPLLTTLEIGVRKGSFLTEKLVNNLTKFVVHVGWDIDNYVSHDKSDAKSTIVNLNGNDDTGMNLWVGKCERYEWRNVCDVKNIMTLQSSEDNRFRHWKEIKIKSCDEMEYLVDTIAERIPSSFFSQLETLRLSKLPKMEEICPFSKIEAPCFTNLREIKITRCLKLKHVFPLSVARELRQLQSMSIAICRYYGDNFL